MLAGTDSHPTGRVIDEIRAIVSAGVPTVDALGAASWRARSFLGFDGLVDGAAADAVVYEADPRRDLDQLEAPGAIILRGHVRHRR